MDTFASHAQPTRPSFTFALPECKLLTNLPNSVHLAQQSRTSRCWPVGEFQPHHATDDHCEPQESCHGEVFIEEKGSQQGSSGCSNPGPYRISDSDLDVP